MRRIGLAAALLVGCSGGDVAPTGPSAPAPDILQSSWVVQAALDESIPGDLVAASGRWLGGPGRWREPGQGPRSSAPGVAALRDRARREDGEALGQLGSILLEANCRLAQAPGSFDAELALGFEVGAESCAALGNDDGAALATKHRAALADAPAPPPAQIISGTPVTVIEVQREGTKLRYSFVRPADLTTALDALVAPADAPSGPTDAMADSFAARVGTSRWFGDDRTVGELPDAGALFAGLTKGADRMAASEEAVDAATATWGAGLAALPGPADGSLDASARALLDGWAGRALKREFGLAALAADEPSLALIHLEDAAGSRARTRPEPGLDPLLLCALARARFESNELRRAVDLLEDIGASPGWELAREAARTVARVAVLPTAAEARVNR